MQQIGSTQNNRITQINNAIPYIISTILYNLFLATFKPIKLILYHQIKLVKIIYYL